MHLLSLVEASLGRSATFDVALVSAALLRVGWQSVSSSRKFILLLDKLAFHTEFFSFYRVHSPKPWIFNFPGFSAVFVLYNLSGAPLRSWGSFRMFHIYGVFRGGSEVVWCSLWLFLLNLVLRIRPNILGGLPLVSGLHRPFSRYWLTAFLWGQLGPVDPFWKGFLIFWRDFFRDGKLLPWKSSPFLLVSSLLDKEGLVGRFSLISYGSSFCFGFSPCYVEDETLK